MDIHSVLTTPNARDLSSIEQKNHPSKGKAPAQTTEPNIQSAIQDLEQVSLAFNKKLQFSINKKLEEVVVKVVDMETDTVIREIPSRELQVIHERIKDAIGLLLDERI